MKKVLLILSAAVCLFSFSAAIAADDAESMFKTRCAGCHGADGGRAPANGIEPIKGQSAADIEKKLHGYKDGTFGGSGKQVMQGIAKGLSDDQMKSLASHAATL